jgi:hypothetical protein
MKLFKTLMFLVASYMRHIPSGSVPWVAIALPQLFVAGFLPAMVLTNLLISFGVISPSRLSTTKAALV